MQNSHERQFIDLISSTFKYGMSFEDGINQGPKRGKKKQQQYFDETFCKLIRHNFF